MNGSNVNAEKNINYTKPFNMDWYYWMGIAGVGYAILQVSTWVIGYFSEEK